MPEAQPPHAAAAPSRRETAGWLVLLGCVSILGQVALLRELQVAFYGSELILLLAFGGLLLGSGLGSLLGGWLRPSAAAQVRALFLALALLLPALAVAARLMRLLLGGVPGAYLPIWGQLLGMAAVLLPFGGSAGLLFQRAASLHCRGGGGLPDAYALESAGGLVGGALATALLALGVPNLQAALGCGALACGAALLRGRREGPPPRRAWPAMAAAALLVGLTALARPLDRWLTGLNHPGLATTRDTAYGRVTARQASGQLVVFVNDALLFESQGTAAEEFVHLAALQVAAPQRVLVLGGAAEGLVCEVLGYAPKHVDQVELDAALREALLPLLPEADRAALGDPCVRLVLADPRSYLAMAGLYDLILVAMGEPESGQSNRFYTREFFALCQGHLATGGVLAFRLRAAENLWSPALVQRTASIYQSLRMIFADALVLPGVTNVVLAADRPLVRDPDELADRWRRRGISARLVSPEYLHYVLTNDRLGEVERALSRARVPPNTDARPICYPYTLVLWLARLYPRAGLWGVPGPGAWWTWGLVAAGLAAACGFARPRPGARRALLAAGAGLAGMILQAVVLLAYQANCGVLYQDLGLLVTLFMGGLAAGSLDLSRRSGRGEPRARLGAGLVAGLAALSLAVAWVASSPGWTGLAAASALLLGSGYLVGGLFAYASLWRSPDPAAAVAPLYAADLLGGCVGSLAGSLFLLPVVGLPASALLVAALSALLLTLV